MRVFLTVDTEVWPRRPGWPHRPLDADDACKPQLDAYFWGGDVAPRQGLPFMLQMLASHHLKATFFVDPLFSLALGRAQLAKVVQLIGSFRQEVGLHLHPEWLTDPRAKGLPEFRGPLLHEYSLDDQVRLVRRGLELLQEAGASEVAAFRAGSWGADVTTMQALQTNGLRIDSSLNPCFGASFPSVITGRNRQETHDIENVREYPATYFETPAGPRPLQLCACSFGEIRYLLEESQRANHRDVVLVSHSFEMVRVGDLDAAGSQVRPRRLVGGRFSKLCRFLAHNRQRFQTEHFRAVPAAEPPAVPQVRPVRSNWPRTLARYAEQAVSEIY